MSSVPMNDENLSLMISEVLSDIGVNNEMVMKRRESILFDESAHNVQIASCDGYTAQSHVYMFGSQSEGSTTVGINSDIDVLNCGTSNSQHVIYDWAEWKPGVRNLLLVQDDATSPGYCLLQLLQDDAPLAATHASPCSAYLRDAKGRVLLKNTAYHHFFEGCGRVQHGPAGMMPGVLGVVAECDLVPALHCEHWPEEGRRWLRRRSQSGWPCDQLKTKSEMSGCFLVPVGSKVGNGLGNLEWRISTSLAERYLMFSLNTTQMGCYVLMKMLLKSFPIFVDVISSYMCKTALFHCIENSSPDMWQARYILSCLNHTLRVLYNFIYHKNCPHFIIPENNLIAERISAVQRDNLLGVIQRLISSNGKALFEIEIDNFGERLQMKLIGLQVYSNRVPSPVQMRKLISAQLCYASADSILDLYGVVLKRNVHTYTNVYDAIQCYLHYYFKYNQLYPNFSSFEQKAHSYVSPLLCSTIGSLLASHYTVLNRPMSDLVWAWLRLGLNSDVSSGLLKLATVCYSIGDYDVTESILRHVEQRYDRTVVMAVCGCHDDTLIRIKPRFGDVVDQIPVNNFRHIVSYCVGFLPCEINVVPREMVQEYYRSTQEDVPYRRGHDVWMDHAVVDSLPYLYFLQYKTYVRLRNRAEQLAAIEKLQQVIDDEVNLSHQETALNLLGQCMEQENRPNDAFVCYERSLQIQPRNNAATFHMSRLLGRHHNMGQYMFNL